MEKYIGYTGFMDAFICFELLEHANTHLKHSETCIPLNHLFYLRSLFDRNFLFRELSDACVFGLIENFEIQERPEGSVIPSRIRLLGSTEIQEIDKKGSIGNSASHLLETEFTAGKYIAIHINPENIKKHLDNMLGEWRKSVSFADPTPSVNYFTSKKQESIITDYLAKKEEEGLDMSSINLKISKLFDNGELDEWLIENNGEEPIVGFNPFIALWSLQEKDILNINFGATVLWTSEEPIYNISMRRTIRSEDISGENNEDRPKVIVSLKTNCPFSFEKESGIVKIRGQELGIISIGNQEFYFFEYLFENYRTAKTHEEIAKYVQEESGSIDKKGKNIGEVKNFCSTIKGKIPESIRSYIHAPKGKYQLLDSQVRKRKKTSKNK